MKRIMVVFLLAAGVAALAMFGEDWSGSRTGAASASSTPGTDVTYDISTLAGKVASVNGTAGLQIRFSAFIEQESDLIDFFSGPSSGPVTPFQILSSPLDGTSVMAPDVTVNQDTAGAPQNETAIAVDPNNPRRIVAGANDYVTLTWTCNVGATPCSALGDGYSGTYFSNDGGATWCCASKLDGSSLGTLIPGVDHLAGGQYDAGGDPTVAFDSRGHVYYAGLGFDRTAPPNTVAVNKGTFDASGNLTWAAPVFINQTTAPSTLNDKEWIVADSNVASPFRDNVYVTWTRFIFNPHNGSYVQSPIAVAVSSDGGKTFSDPQLIVGNVLYGQGSRPVVGPDGTVYVFWDASTRLATLDSIWVVKSTDGGKSWSKPVAVSPLVDIIPVANTVFRNNSYPAAAVAPNGDLYVAWGSMMSNGGGLCPARTNSGCHAASLYSKSTDGGATWSAPALVLPGVDASTRAPVGYPVTQPDGSMLNAPAARRVDTLFPAVAVSATGRVYMSAYAADVVSPWQTCANFGAPSLNGENCKTLGPYINNARLDYVVKDLTSGVTNTVTTQPINTRYGFRGRFFGDYTHIAAGSDDVFHAFWTDSNNVQNVNWWAGAQWVAGTKQHQQDVVVRSDSF
ncbi:MAG TPA: sialidase family protein [Candidatus Acidoferrum sp.]|nr:sialidase family protein [Candidatus Acidoferrum sp.]